MLYKKHAHSLSNVAKAPKRLQHSI